MPRLDRPRARRGLDLLETGFLGCSVGGGNPRGPVVPKPQGRQKVQLGRLRPPVDRRDLHQDVVRAVFGVLDEDVEVAVVLKDAGVEQFVLHLVAGAPAVRFHQISIGERRLRVLIEVLHVGMCRRAVEVEVIFFDVLAVVAFAVCEPEEPLLEDRVFSVPEGERKAEELLVIGNPRQPVLAPAIGP